MCSVGERVSYETRVSVWFSYQACGCNVDQMVQYVQFVVACYGSVYSIDYHSLILTLTGRYVGFVS